MLPKKSDEPNCFKSRYNNINLKIAIKEKKADKRKEKSRVAAQIRRNKESQTLILLQNALPIDLPSPNQMLEKSIVIRIAGQTLFLLKNLDQVLGMSDWLTVPLISSNFLAFFTDNIGQIVYVTPNIQTFLEQYHWSNLIGISIFDVMDFKSRWPGAGEIIKLKLLSNPSASCENKSNKTHVTPMSFSPSLSYPNYFRSTIASKINLRSSPPIINQYSPPCSIYTVWCSTNISHTNSKLRLLLLRQVQLQSIAPSNSYFPETPKPFALPNREAFSLDQSLRWSLSLNQIKLGPTETDSQVIKVKCIQASFLISVHDRKYNFEAVSSEFVRIIGETESDLMQQNLLEVVHIEDIIRVKSYLDSIIEKTDNNVWTPIYRLMCQDGRYCLITTLAKQYSSSCSQIIILYHKIIRTGLNCECPTKYGMYELKKKQSSTYKVKLATSPNKNIMHIQKSAPYIMYQNSTHPLFLKRKPSIFFNEKVTHLSENDDHTPDFIQSYSDKEKSFGKILKPNIQKPSKDMVAENSILEKDPFLPTCLEKRLIFNHKLKSEKKNTNRPQSIYIDQIKINTNLKDRFENESNCSASHSLESCVLTSPSPDSVEINLDDQILWDFPDDSLNELTQSNNWFDEHYQNDLELLLPI